MCYIFLYCVEYCCCKRKLCVVTTVFQGDMEKSLGWKPIPLFDKDYAGEMPAMQVILLSVCVIVVWLSSITPKLRYPPHPHLTSYISRLVSSVGSACPATTCWPSWSPSWPRCWRTALTIWRPGNSWQNRGNLRLRMRLRFELGKDL